MTTTTSNKPAATLRDGRLKATVWKNTGEKGTFHRVDFSRSYQDAKGDWHDSTSFSGTELLRLSHLALKAYDKVAELRSPDDAGEDADQ